MIKGCQSPDTYETKNLSYLLLFTSDASQAHLSVEPYLAVSILASIHLFSTEQPAQSCKNKSDHITLSFKALQDLFMELETKSPSLTLNVPPSRSPFLTTCLVHGTPAALLFMWFLDDIFTRDLCSSHDFLLECSIP